MPNHLKFIISAIAVIVAVAIFWLDTRAGAGGAARWIALAHLNLRSLPHFHPDTCPYGLWQVPFP